LRDEIQMFQRRLGQEETLNKQLSGLNDKLQANMGELRSAYTIEMKEERIDILAGVPQSYKPSTTPVDDEILERKKAWADLEREQQEVKRDI
jgi:hypothetical protein